MDDKERSRLDDLVATRLLATTARDGKLAERAYARLNAAADGSTVSADLARSRGNDAYRLRRLDEAIEWYTVAHMLAPTSSLPVSNRSAAFYEAAAYDECIADVQQALLLEDPPVAKLCLRGAKAAIALDDLGTAEGLARHAKDAKCDEPSLTSLTGLIASHRQKSHSTRTRQ